MAAYCPPRAGSFQGTGTGEFIALDAKTGARLWSAPTQTGVIAAPMTYTAGGVQ